MIAFPVLSLPGLNLKEIVSGREPQALSTASICVISSRFNTAPSSKATLNSSSGVSLLVNIMFLPSIPASFAMYSSGSEEQSAPKPCFPSSLSMLILGRAFTAK